MMNDIPDVFWKIEAYTNGYQIVVLGTPPMDQEEGDPLYHNCDAMGCSGGEHVVARIPVLAPHPELNWGDYPPRIAEPEVAEQVDGA